MLLSAITVQKQTETLPESGERKPYLPVREKSIGKRELARQTDVSG